MAAATGFHVTVNGPAGTAFPSFPSSDIANGDTGKIFLGDIRKKCGISHKLFFTVDGKSPVGDNLSLAYYMNLTDSGSEILKPKAAAATEKTEPAKDEAEKKSEANIQSFTVNVAGKDSAPEPLLPLPAKNEALAKLAESIGKDTLALGKLPTFDNRDLASLSANYAVAPSGKEYIHPANMKESDWARVMINNRALYGYWFDFSGRNAITKAKKRAFKLKPRASIYDDIEDEVPATKGAATTTKVDDQVLKARMVPIPPFYVNDDASVTVHETRDQSQATLTKQGFSSKAIEFSLGGAASSIAASAEASYAKEQSSASQDVSKTDVQALIVTYNFPRVVVELDAECLELTAECREDAMNVTSKADVARFYRDYGNVFACSFGLGGFLQSTRNVSSSEQSSLTQIKNTTRASAGISIQTPVVSASMNYAQVDSNSTDTGKASLHQEVRLAWDARGGDTVLCSNPPAWANTVKDFNLWRLMEQQQIVSLEGLLRSCDVAAWMKLDDPVTPKTDPNKGKDAVSDDKARAAAMTAYQEKETSATAAAMRKYYQAQKFDTAGGEEPINKFLREKYPKDPDMVLTPGKLFGDISLDQFVGVALYMNSLGELRLT